jgi:hypothetical protein
MSGGKAGEGAADDPSYAHIVAQRMLVAFNDRRVEELLGICDPEIEIETPLLGLWGERTRGRAAVRAWVSRIDAEWAFLVVQADALEPVGDWMLGRGRARGRGKASRSELTWDLHVAVRVVGGRVVRLGAYLTAEEARAVVEGAEPEEG